MAKKSKRASKWTIAGLTATQKAVAGLVTGLALAGAGAFTLSFALDHYTVRIRAASAPAESRYVFVAARDLTVGVRIQDDDVFALSLPVTLVKPGMIENPQQVVGRFPREPILHNEFIRDERLADPERGDGLNALLPRGMRALSIEIANGAALAGHLEPGSYIDVLATFFPEDEDAGSEVTRTIAQGLFVLAVNDRSVVMSPQDERDGRKVPRPSVTLLVTPAEAEVVVLAEGTTTLQLALRSDLDDRYAETFGVDARAVLRRLEVQPRPEHRVGGAAPPVVTDAEARASDQIRIIHGSKVAVVETHTDPEAPASP